MKRKAILLTIIGVLIPFMLGAQNVSLKTDDMALEKVLVQIENQTDYLFVYDKMQIDMSAEISLDIKNVPIEKALNVIFEGRRIMWKIVGKNIVLTPVTEHSGKEYSMSCIVVDQNGEPLIGVVVMWEGTNSGVVADMDGKVVLDGLTDATVLVASCVGYKDKRFNARKADNVKIVMEEDAKLLEAAVAVGYGTLERKNVTSSIASVSSDELMKGVGGGDVTKQLQGMIPGLVISQTKSVNESATMQLRGMASIVAGTEPLVVIDGFPGGDIRSINPDDIKSIEVLKDASAGAIYGTRAAAGVILVTTKSGYDSDGKLSLTYSTNLLHKQAYRHPHVLTAQEYVEHNVGKNYGSSTDWWNECINTTNFSQKHSLSVNFGTKKAKLYSSFFYEKMDGLAKKEYRNDLGGRINASYKFFEGWFEIGTNIDYRQSDRSFSSLSFGQALLNNPTRSPYDASTKTGYNIWTGEANDYNIVADNTLYTNGGVDRWLKPEAILKLNVLSVPGLSYQQTLGYDLTTWTGRTYRSLNHRLSIENNVNGFASMEHNKIEKLSAEGYFTYDNLFAGKHKVNAVAGYSYYQYDTEYGSMSNSDFSVDGIENWDIGKGTYLGEGLADMSSKKGITEKLLAFFGRATYTYADRYIVSATYRREGSSKFGPKNRWGNFWAVSAGWNIMNERWMKNVKWIDELKLRVGYGVTGNNDFNAAYSGKFIGADENKWLMPDGEWRYTYGREENVNETLGWESKGEFNFGVDFAMFNNRFYGKFDVYRRHIKDMLFYVRVPVGTYINSYQWQNVGSMENKGWELELGGDIVRKNDFNFRAKVNLAHSDSRVLTMDTTGTKWDGGTLPGPNSPGTSIILTNGSQIGQYYIYEFAGFNKSGNFLIVDRNGNTIPASSKIADDRKLMGNFVPKVMIGGSLNFDYKDFDLSVNMHSWLGFDVYNTYTMTLGLANKNGELNVLREAYSTFSHIKGEKVMSNYWLEDGSFLKFDAITLGYNLKLNKYTKDIVQKLRVYFTLGNPFIITRYWGNDPEVSITGYSGGVDDYTKAYPNFRTYSFGAQLNF